MKPEREVAHAIYHGCPVKFGWHRHDGLCDDITDSIDAAEARGFERGATWMREQAEIATSGLRFGAPTWRSAGEVIRALPAVPR